MKHAARDSDPACHCGSARVYRDCCEPLHLGAPAPDAGSLMRSRYCAYVRGLDDYLRESWHPSTRPATLASNPGELAPTWLGLAIKSQRS
ncbi:MAG: YchJ family metal-binding protein, partial [Tahibacter sp.]